jgi:hypothetical protein
MKSKSAEYRISQNAASGGRVPEESGDRVTG